MKCKLLVLAALVSMTALVSAAETEQKVFDAVGSHTWDVPSHVTEAEVLVVGGGGGGGATRGGGGGAGEVLYKNVDVSENNTIAITVGSGGSGGTNPGDGSCGYGARNNAENGEKSEFGNLVAEGGGGGAPHGCDGKDGASGGGGGTDYGNGGSSTSENGNPGGDADVNCGRSGLAGGGGGAGEKGTTSICSDGYIEQPGDGGDGVYYGDKFGDEYGENGWFGGGGGGGHEGRTDISGEVRESYGGKGGAGDSAAPSDGQTSSANGKDAMENTGGGGGGGNYETGSGGNGGSGIVIVKYQSEIPICDRRGTLNECISNQTHNVSSKIFDITSIFQVEEEGSFDSLYGQGTIKVTNSSLLSGTWKGSFEILSRQVKVKPGARFTPENGRIIIGK